MIPDVRTMWMVMATTALLFGMLEIWVGYRKPRDPAMALWGFANLAGGIGAGLLSARDLVPYVLTVAFANAALTLFWGLIWAGQRAFNGERIRWWVVASGPMLMFSAFMYIPPFPSDMVMRLHFISAVIVGYLLLIATDALRAEHTEYLIMRRALAVVCAGSTVPVIWRSAHAQLSVGPHDLMANTAEAATPLVALFVIAVAINICMLLIGRERLGNDLARAAQVDGLTGTLNRSGFLAHAQEVVATCTRSSQPCSVVVMDLDEFKAVNDRYGHAVGDLLLAGFASIAQRTLRSGDVLGRIGGEEFAALLPTADEPEAVAVVDRLRSMFAEATFDHPGGVLSGTVSMGVAQVGAAEELAAALQRADRAMYQAKNEGRDRVARASS